MRWLDAAAPGRRPAVGTSMMTKHQLPASIDLAPVRPPPPPLQRWVLTALLTAEATLLLLVAARNPDRMNPDAVAYIQIAKYYAHARFGLAINAYWGPLLSWIMAPLIRAGMAPLMAARLAMALSGFIFLLGAREIFQVLRLRGWASILANLIAGLFAVAQSAEIITPDLLMSGIVCLGFARILAAEWTDGRGAAWRAGALLGLGYVAKSVALPLAILLIVTGAAFAVATRRVALRPVLRAVRASIFGAALLAGPWIAVLSLHANRFAWSDSGWINLAIVGPHYTGTGPEWRPPSQPSFTTFNVPAPGRVSSWEDPASLRYVSWSPLASWADFRHELRLVRDNLSDTLHTLFGFDWLHLGLGSLLLAPLLVGAPAWREAPWRLGLVPVVCVSGLYLPLYSSGEQRYLFVCYPFLVAGAIGMARIDLIVTRSGQANTRHRGWAGMRTVLATALIATSFLGAMRYNLEDALVGRANPWFLAARAYARTVREQRDRGAIASVKELGFVGIFTAFLLDRPFYGTSDSVPGRAAAGSDLGAALATASGARLVFVARGSAIDRALQEDPHYRLIELPAASRSGQAAASREVRLYARLGPMPPG